jgi:predicted CopG family antitoxin
MKYKNIMIKESTYKELISVKGALEMIDGKSYTFDEVIHKLASSMMIEMRKKVNAVGDEFEKIL